MENKCKRFLSLLLALVMVIGLMPLNHAHAAAFETTPVRNDVAGELTSGTYVLVSANKLYRDGNVIRAVSTTVGDAGKLLTGTVALGDVDDIYVWTLDIVSGDNVNGYTAKIKAADGQCMALVDGKVTLAADTTVTIEPGNSNHSGDFGNNFVYTWGINFGSTYLNNSEPVGTYSFDCGSHWVFYKLDPYNKANWEKISVDSETIYDASEGNFEYAWDGNTSTKWHSDWQGETKGKLKAHGDSNAWDTISGAIDFGVEVYINRFSFLPRQDDTRWANGDGVVTIGSLYKGTLNADGSYTWEPLAEHVEFPHNQQWKTFCFEAQNVQYVKFVAEKSVYDGWVVVSEFDIGYEAEHTYTENTTAATCTQDGSTVYTCGTDDRSANCVCHHTYTEVIPAGHTLVNAEAQEATCTEPGWAAYQYCTNCDYTTKVEITATGHAWGEWTEETPATCIAVATLKRVCENDPTHIETQNGTEYADHTWDNGVYTAPDFGEDGYTTYTCTVEDCGETKVETETGSAKVAVAEVNGEKFETFEAALTAAGEDGIITLLVPVTVTTDTTYDLKNVTITSDSDVFVVTDGATLTLNGNGTVNAGASGVGSWCAVWANGGHVVINGGTYSVRGDSNPNTDPNHQNDLIYTKNGGTVKIYGGTFQYTEGVWTLNENDANRGTITVYGGTFENWNPANNTSEGEGTNFVAEGYCAAAAESNIYVVAAHVAGEVEVENNVDPTLNSNGSYDNVTYCVRCGEQLSRVTVTVPALTNAVAEVNGTKYESLADAVEAAEAGATVKLLANTNGDGIIIDKNITIDLGGYTYTINGVLVGSAKTKSNGFQILKDNDVTIKNGAIVMDDAAVRGHDNLPGKNYVIQNYADLTLDGVTVTGNTHTTYVVSINSGKVVMTGTTINAPEGAVAFDVCKYLSYAEPTVTLDACSINGKIEAAAKVGNTYYATFETALAADGNEIELLVPVTVTKDTEYNIEGKTITSAGDAFVVESGTLTLEGNGTVNAGTSGVGSWTAVWANGGHVVINGGTYSVGGDSNPNTDPNHQNDLIYTKNGGTVTINGGTFLYTEGVWTLNENDANRGTITVYGGTFENWDPANNVSEGAGTNFVAEGYCAIEQDGYYTVRAHAYEIIDGKLACACGEVFTGIYEDSIYLDGILQKAYQLIAFEGSFYFINDNDKIAKGCVHYLSEEHIGDNVFADGAPIPAGLYEFDADGKMIIPEDTSLNGVVGDYFYISGVKQLRYQLVEFEGSYYFINDYDLVAKNCTLFLRDEFVEGHTFSDGSAIPAGLYEFDENGKLVRPEVKNGVYNGYLYINNVRQSAYELVEYDGHIYFVYDAHKIAVDTTLYLSERFVTGKTYNGEPIPVGFYYFNEDGWLVID